MSHQKRGKGITLPELCLMIYYAWFFLPFMRTVFTGVYTYIFFAFFIAGIALLVLQRVNGKGMRIKVRWSILVPIICYMAVLLLLTLFGVGDAGKHIRVSFTFWGTVFVYYLLGNNPRARNRFGLFLLAIACLTVLTSYVGILTNPRAARAVSNASRSVEALETDQILGRQNIASLYLYQCMAVVAPIYVAMIRQGKRLWGSVLLIFTCAVILQASFTICLLVLVCGVVLSFFYSKSRISGLIIFALMAVMIVLPWGDILSAMAGAIDNNLISRRLYEMSSFFDSGIVGANMGNRAEAYAYSLRTIAANPFGVGPNYSYRVGDQGIGHHSQLLDDVARYGVFGAAFYLAFLISYYRLLKEQWAKVRMEEVAFPITVIYCCFIVLNLAFRSGIESVIMLYILPALPDIILERKACSQQAAVKLRSIV